MFERFSDRGRKTLSLANSKAKQLNHELVGPEHLLLGLVEEGHGVAASVLKSMGVDLDAARQAVLKVVQPGPELVSLGRLPHTPRTKKVIEFAVEEARQFNHRYIGTEHLLLGLLRERDGVAAQILMSMGIELNRVRAEVLYLLGEGPGPQVAISARDCPLCNVVQESRQSRSFIAELHATVAVLGENQGCRGWCVLITKDHREHLSALPESLQSIIFADVMKIAEAIRRVFPESGQKGGPPRINYECLGNLVPHIHWHVIPRHGDDPEPTKAVWGWSEERLRGTMTEEERAELVQKLRAALNT